MAEAEDVRDRLDDGDDTVTAADLARTNDDEIDRLRRLAAAAGRSVEVARRGLVPTDLTLGQVVADSVGRLLPEPVPTTVSSSRPEEPPADLPALVVVQRREHSADLGEGTLSGEVEVTYFRSRLHLPLPDDAAVERAASAHQVGCRVRSRSGREAGAVVVDTVMLEVKRAWAPVPVLAPSDLRGADAYRLAFFGQGLASDLARALQTYSGPYQGVSIGAGVSGTVDTVKGSAGEVRLTSDRIDAEGVRRVSVEVPVAVFPHRSAVHSGEAMQDALVRSVEGQRGRCERSLGRITSAEVRNIGRVEGGHRTARTGTAVLTFTSRLPEGATTASPRPVSHATSTEGVPAPRRTPDVRERLSADGQDVGKHPGVQ